jgi:hypothetical protein
MPVIEMIARLLACKLWSDLYPCFTILLEWYLNQVVGEAKSRDDLLEYHTMCHIRQITYGLSSMTGIGARTAQLKENTQIQWIKGIMATNPLCEQGCNLPLLIPTRVDRVFRGMRLPERLVPCSRVLGSHVLGSGPKLTLVTHRLSVGAHLRRGIAVYEELTKLGEAAERVMMALLIAGPCPVWWFVYFYHPSFVCEWLSFGNLGHMTCKADRGKTVDQEW